MAYAEIIETSIGSCRCWQISVFFLVCLVNISLAMQELSLFLLAPPVSFNCSDTEYDRCSSECPSIVWNKIVFKKTITMEWDLICGKEWLQKFSQTIWIVGILIGNLLFGLLSDKYGRRKPIIIAVIIEMVTGITVAVSPNFWLFVFLRLLVAVVAGGASCIGIVLIIECIGRKHRSYFIILFLISYYIGESILGLIGYFIREWRYVQIVISIPIFLSTIYYWFLPESPRWLLSVGKYEKAIEIMEKAAKVNRMPVENVKRNVLDELEHTVPAEETFLDLFKHRVIRLRTICICINWIALSLCSSAFDVFINLSIANNIFVQMPMVSLGQIALYIIFCICIERQGRRSGTIIRNILSLVVLIIIVILFYYEFIIFCLCIMGRMILSLNFVSMFIWSGELFATPVRNAGIGLCVACAKLGSIPFLYMFTLIRSHFCIPPVLFGVASILMIVISFWLPETKDQSMPDSTEEAEMVGLE